MSSTTIETWTAPLAPAPTYHGEPTLGGPPVYSRDGRWRWTGQCWERRDPDAA